MTIAEYLSLAAFPLTTDPALSLENQIRSDTDSYNGYRYPLRRGVPLTAHQRAAGRELEAKRRGLPGVLQQMAQQREGARSPNDSGGP